MSDQRSPTEFVKSNGLFMFGGLLLCGIIGYFIAGSEGRALGGGIGAVLGLIVGGAVGKLRK
ncbi:MAG: hypothetical protein ACO3Z6_13130 [Pseudomonadales bacterium]